MNTVLHARGLGKKYGRRWALTDCTLEVPPARVVGLVGPNGAGKTTFLNLAVGMLTPSAGEIEVLGERPTGRTPVRARVGFVGQDTPTYAGMRVRDHLRLGAALNPRWNATLAEERIRRLRLDPAQRTGRLSGGQRAQLALTMGLAKRPELLLLALAGMFTGFCFWRIRRDLAWAPPEGVARSAGAGPLLGEVCLPDGVSQDPDGASSAQGAENGPTAGQSGESGVPYRPTHDQPSAARSARGLLRHREPRSR